MKKICTDRNGDWYADICSGFLFSFSNRLLDPGTVKTKLYLKLLNMLQDSLPELQEMN